MYLLSQDFIDVYDLLEYFENFGLNGNLDFSFYMKIKSYKKRARDKYNKRKDAKGKRRYNK